MIRTWFCFIVFVLLQVLVMNNIHLFNLVTPFVYLYVILKLPVDMNRLAVIPISFLLGLSVDWFSNTFGMHAAATTLMGFVRLPLLQGFVDMKEIPEKSIPSYRLLGVGKFVLYAFILVIVHHLALFIVESFTFFQPLFMLVRMGLSIVLTTLLMCIFEAFNFGGKKSGE